MKKLLAVLLTLVSIPCLATLITHNDYTSGSTISSAGQNTNENNIIGVVNGNLDNSNIGSGAAIAVNKLATVTASRVTCTDSNGYLTASCNSTVLVGTTTLQGGTTIQGNVVLTGTLQFSSTTGVAFGIIGSTSADAAGTGYVGESTFSYVASAAAPSPSGNFGDLTSIQLTAGDWDVSAIMECSINSANWSLCEVGISTTAGNTSANLSAGSNDAAAQWATSTTTPLTQTLSIPSFRMSLNQVTNVYMKIRNTYASGQPLDGGRLSARRVR